MFFYIYLIFLVSRSFLFLFCLLWIHSYRFRWKNLTQQGKYKNVTLQLPDAKCAAALCRGGAIYYHLKEESELSPSWICEHVSPNITRVFGTILGNVLGRALLWRIMDPIDSAVLPTEQVRRVRSLYQVRNNTLNDDENPVCKILLEVSGNNGQLVLTPLLPEKEEDSDDKDKSNTDKDSTYVAQCCAEL